MQQISLTSKRRQRGGSIVEVALMAPWIFFLFVGIFDFGFYAYAAICTQNAARAVALSQAQSATASAQPCAVALGEMRMLPNVGSNPVFTCGTNFTVSQAAPVAVCVRQLGPGSGTNTNCGLPAATCADCALDAAAVSEEAEVTYQTVPFVPIPGLLTGQLTLTRIAEVRQTTP